MYVSATSENNNFVKLSSDQNFYWKKGSRITKNYDFCNKEGFLERYWVSQGQTVKWWLDIVSWVAPPHRYVKIRFLYSCLKTFFGLPIYMTTSGSQGFFFLFFFLCAFLLFWMHWYMSSSLFNHIYFFYDSVYSCALYKNSARRGRLKKSHGKFLARLAEISVSQSKISGNRAGFFSCDFS